MSPAKPTSVTYSARLNHPEADRVEAFRGTHGYGRSEFVRRAILTFIGQNALNEELAEAKPTEVTESLETKSPEISFRTQFRMLAFLIIGAVQTELETEQIVEVVRQIEALDFQGLFSVPDTGGDLCPQK